MLLQVNNVYFVCVRGLCRVIFDLDKNRMIFVVRVLGYSQHAMLIMEFDQI